jgi:hypothetical protein
MFLVATEAQNSPRYKRVVVFRIRPDGTGYRAGMYNKQTNVYTPKLRITRDNTLTREFITRLIRDSILEAPKPPLLGLLPALVAPGDEEEAE